LIFIFAVLLQTSHRHGEAAAAAAAAATPRTFFSGAANQRGDVGRDGCPAAGLLSFSVSTKSLSAHSGEFSFGAREPSLCSLD
jgi:hypothetical protein